MALTTYLTSTKVEKAVELYGCNCLYGMLQGEVYVIWVCHKMD